MTNKEIEKIVLKIQKMLTEHIKETKNQLTINDIKVGKQFIYGDKIYTKLNKNNFCLIDEFCSDFMWCIFDPITNNYNESLMRNYINSDRFIARLGINKEDIIPHYADDLITLLSKEECEQYTNLIKEYDGYWATRSAYSNYGSYFCYINSSGYIYSTTVYNSHRARVGFTLNPNTPVDRKGNNETEDKE